MLRVLERREGRTVLARVDEDVSQVPSGLWRRDDALRLPHRDGMLDQLDGLAIFGGGEVLRGLEDQHSGKARVIAGCLCKSGRLGERRVDPVALGQVDQRQAELQANVDRVLAPALLIRELFKNL